MQLVLQNGDFTTRNFGLIYPISWKRLKQEWYDMKTHQQETHIGMSYITPCLWGWTYESWEYFPLLIKWLIPALLSRTQNCILFVKALLYSSMYHLGGGITIQKGNIMCGPGMNRELAHMGTHHVFILIGFVLQPGQGSLC